MRPARTDFLLYRSPAAVGDQEGRTVFRGSRRDRRVFVEYLEAVELHDVIVLMIGAGIELPERQLLETPNGCGRIRVDPNCIPGLENLGAQMQHLSRGGAEGERLTARAKTVDERRV